MAVCRWLFLLPEEFRRGRHRDLLFPGFGLPHTGQISSRYSEAKTHGVELHVWSRKEIENFLLVPTAIQRIIQGGCKARISPPSLQDVKDEIHEIAERVKDDVFDGFCTEFATDRSLAAGTANKMARERVAQAWGSFEGRMAVIPGKQTISALSEWSQAKCGVSLNATKIAELSAGDEIYPELELWLKR